jgi:predicted metallopeptidase
LQKPLPPPVAVNGSPRFASLNGHARLPKGRIGFDFSAAMQGVFADIARRSDDFGHVDASRILATITQARLTRKHGLQARITPLRFKEGKLVERRRGRFWQVQRHRVEEVELLYIITFVMPRFLNQTFEQKLVTIFHELWHIAPAFNGDLRRHQGRCTIHTSSKKRYDARMKELSEAYLAKTDFGEGLAFLRESCEQLHARHGGVRGYWLPMPKLALAE